MPIDFSKFQKKEASDPLTPEKKDTQKKPILGATKISPVKNIEKQEIEPKIEINESLELNLIKSLYANRFGSTTNRTKAHMIRKIKNAWKY